MAETDLCNENIGGLHPVYLLPEEIRATIQLLEQYPGILPPHIAEVVAKLHNANMAIRGVEVS